MVAWTWVSQPSVDAALYYAGQQAFLEEKTRLRFWK